MKEYAANAAFIRELNKRVKEYVNDIIQSENILDKEYWQGRLAEVEGLLKLLGANHE